MKRTILLLFLLFFLVGCGKEKINTITNDNQEIDDAIEVKDTYQDDNPIKVGLYMNGKLQKEYTTSIIDGQDIAVFEVYYTNDSDVGNGSTKYNFNKYYSNYENIDNYKIGFYLGFETTEGKMGATILDPSKMHELYYIYNYLYDDIHQADGAWYSHVEMGDVKENTLYTSIKLYAGGYTYKITSPITLTVFTYDDMDDFDENGNYRGKSSYTVTIKNA